MSYVTTNLLGRMVEPKDKKITGPPYQVFWRWAWQDDDGNPAEVVGAYAWHESSSRCYLVLAVKHANGGMGEVLAEAVNILEDSNAA